MAKVLVSLTLMVSARAVLSKTVAPGECGYLDSNTVKVKLKLKLASIAVLATLQILN